MAEGDDPIKSANEAMALLGQVMKAAGDNPDVKSAGAELGKTALTVTKAINAVLLPVAALNFAVDRAKRYFSESFEKDFAPKAQRIPPERFVEPKLAIAGPALQGLAFQHEEPPLKEMYLNLLASAMDSRSASGAHPAFVEVI